MGDGLANVYLLLAGLAIGVWLRWWLDGRR